jgi:hypothetical protein
MATGYIYAIQTESKPELLKVGFTTRTPEKRLKEHNSWNPMKPSMSWCEPWNIVFTKKVHNARQKERILHVILEKYWVNFGCGAEHYNEIYNISLEKFIKYYHLMQIVEDLIEEDWEETAEEERIKEKKISKKKIIGYANNIIQDEEQYEDEDE